MTDVTVKTKPISKRTRLKAFVTKYALSGGIQEIEAEDCFAISRNMIRDINSSLSLYHKGDWHRTKEDAVARAEEMRTAKIASLEKSIERIKKLKF
jgi:hypothetical protein